MIDYKNVNVSNPKVITDERRELLNVWGTDRIELFFDKYGDIHGLGTLVPVADRLHKFIEVITRCEEVNDPRASKQDIFNAYMDQEFAQFNLFKMKEND